MYTHKKVNLNPTMAVLVSPLTIRNLRRQVVNPRIKRLVEANKEVNNILYYFCLKEVKLKERKITGYFWHSRFDKWLLEEFSFPDILYIRGGINKKYTHVFEELFSSVSISGKVINYPRFNKWQLYQIMNKDPVMRSYLPVTREVNEPEDIEKMLQEYRVIYLKAHLGRKGKNVLRVDVLSEDCYQYSYLTHGKLTIQTASSLQSLIDVINTFFRGKRFLIQQSIELMKFESRLVDMRAELQRSRDGSLEIVGISVRIGQPGSPITTHADSFRFDKFLKNKLHYSEEMVRRLQSNVNDFLLSVYRFIENNYGEYVEIGIDFAIDANEKIWFIEANSQSAKVSLEKAYDSAVVSRAYKNILEYARYLFMQKHGSKNYSWFIEENSKSAKATWKWPDGTVLSEAY